MPMTNFPKGFLSGLSVRRMPLLQTHPGNIFWVDNGAPSILPNVTSAGADGNPGTLQRRVQCGSGSRAHAPPAARLLWPTVCSASSVTILSLTACMSSP